MAVRSYARARRPRQALLSPRSSRRTCVAGISRHREARLGCYRGSLGQGVGETMGQGVGKAGGLMCSGPSKAAEAIVAVFVPPACREEVLGDLHERYSSPRQYALDALRT